MNDELRMIPEDVMMGGFSSWWWGGRHHGHHGNNVSSWWWGGRDHSRRGNSATGCWSSGGGGGLGGSSWSVLQPGWDYLRLNHQEALRSPLFPVVLSVSTYVLLVTFYTTLDLLAPTWPLLRRYKLHPDRRVPADQLWTTLRLTLHHHLIYIFPAAVAQWAWRPTAPLPPAAPTLGSLLTGVLGCLLLFDFQYYLWHLLHHRVAWLYRTFHAVHHQYSRPFSLVTQYVSGWELVSSGFWATADPILLQCHCLTTWGFMVFNVYVSTEDHCGYSFPWSMHRLVPLGLWAGAPKHDAHHQRPHTNYAPFFCHWDWLGGTHGPPITTSADGPPITTSTHGPPITTSTHGPPITTTHGLPITTSTHGPPITSTVQAARPARGQSAR